MHSSNSMKKEILKNLSKGLRICRSSIKSASVTDRKDAIKLSADIAMAAAKKGTAFWSRALISNASRNNSQKLLIHRILKKNGYPKKLTLGNSNKMINIRSKKILRKSRIAKRRRIIKRNKKNLSGLDAKSLVKKKIEKLKSLVPGGELMEERRLIGETLDYIVSLRAQVEVMRSLAD